MTFPLSGNEREGDMRLTKKTVVRLKVQCDDCDGTGKKAHGGECLVAGCEKNFTGPIDLNAPYLPCGHTIDSLKIWEVTTCHYCGGTGWKDFDTSLERVAEVFGVPR
jgi:hypothetical protein